MKKTGLIIGFIEIILGITSLAVMSPPKILCKSE